MRRQRLKRLGQRGIGHQFQLHLGVLLQPADQRRRDAGQVVAMAG